MTSPNGGSFIYFGISYDIYGTICCKHFIGKHFIGILGILTLFSFFITAMLGLAFHHRWWNIRFIWHPVMVIISFVLAFINVYYEY